MGAERIPSSYSHARLRQVQKLLEHGFRGGLAFFRCCASAEELKRNRRTYQGKDVSEQIKKAKAPLKPTVDPHLFQNVYTSDSGSPQNEFPLCIRMPDFAKAKNY